jgi:hypothetical protein
MVTEFEFTIEAGALSAVIEEGSVLKWKGGSYKVFLPYLKKQYPGLLIEGAGVAQSIKACGNNSEWRRQTIKCGHGGGFICIEYHPSEYKPGEAMKFQGYWNKNRICEKCEFCILLYSSVLFCITKYKKLCSVLQSK